MGPDPVTRGTGQTRAAKGTHVTVPWFFFFAFFAFHLRTCVNFLLDASEASPPPAH